MGMVVVVVSGTHDDDELVGVAIVVVVVVFADTERSPVHPDAITTAAAIAQKCFRTEGNTESSYRTSRQAPRPNMRQ